MSDDCAQEYAYWEEVNEELEDQENDCEQYAGWKTAYKQITQDLFDGNFGTAGVEAIDANAEQVQYAKCGWAADRIRNGEWADAVDALWDCLNKHRWQEETN
jgi:hypothetical protein